MPRSKAVIPALVASLGLAVFRPAFPDTLTVAIPDSPVPFMVGDAGLVGTGGNLFPDGSRQIIFDDNLLTGPWAIACCSANIDVPAGSTVNSVDFAFSGVQVETDSFNPGMYTVTGTAGLTQILVGVISNGCSSPSQTEIDAPFDSAKTYQLAVPCAAATSFFVQPTFSGAATETGQVLSYPSYNSSLGGDQTFELLGSMSLAVPSSVTADYTPAVPEPGEWAATALIMACLAALTLRRRLT